MVDFIRRWSEKTGLAIERLLGWLELSVGKFYDWGQRYGLVNQHNGGVPRDFWLQDAEKQAILDFQELYPLENYRRLTYMMIDSDIVAVSQRWILLRIWFSFQRACGLFSSMEKRRRACSTLLRLVVKLCNCSPAKEAEYFSTQRYGLSLIHI